MRTISCLTCIVCLTTAAAAQEQVYKPGEGVTTPVAIDQPRPQYTADALTARVEGIVTLECVVGADGTVSEGRVVKSLFPSLDDVALRTVQDWKFKPGTKDGKPVPVRVNVEMSFSLSDSPEVRGPRVDSPDVLKPSKEVTAPRLLHEVKPQYTARAIRERAQGKIRMACVVLPDGTVGDVQVKESLHPDLDLEAVRTLRKWRFVPGMTEGSAVPVQVEIEMTFTLRGGPAVPKLER
jgi:TonB family protein